MSHPPNTSCTCELRAIKYQLTPGKWAEPNNPGPDYLPPLLKEKKCEPLWSHDASTSQHNWPISFELRYHWPVVIKSTGPCSGSGQMVKNGGQNAEEGAIRVFMENEKINTREVWGWMHGENTKKINKREKGMKWAP